MSHVRWLTTANRNVRSTQVHLKSQKHLKRLQCLLLHHVFQQGFMLKQNQTSIMLQCIFRKQLNAVDIFPRKEEASMRL